LWITEYLDDIEADFVAIYHLLEYGVLDGPKFLRLASRLPLYEGAVRRRLELEQSAQQPAPVQASEDFRPGEKMSMKEALARSSGNDTDVLKALNSDHANSQFGPLFEYSTATAD